MGGTGESYDLSTSIWAIESYSVESSQMISSVFITVIFTDVPSRCLRAYKGSALVLYFKLDKKKKEKNGGRNG